MKTNTFLGNTLFDLPFDLKDSDNNCGSLISIDDIIKIFDNYNYPKEYIIAQINKIKPILMNNIKYYDETELQNFWYNLNAKKNGSFDEAIIFGLLKQFKDIEIIKQYPIKRFKIDFKITKETGEIYYLEFDGPSHYMFTRFGPPKDPFHKKKLIEDLTGNECIIFPYWAQKCYSNLYNVINPNNKILGYGALWGCKIHFGNFYHNNSAQIIIDISNRLNLNLPKEWYLERKNNDKIIKSEHPIINDYKNGKILKTQIEQLLIPKGINETNFNEKIWLPINF
jgi:hypothetical protein